jgi:TonB family protein
MTVLLDATLRVSLVMAVVLVATASMRRRAASMRHAALAGGLVLSACVVPLSWLLPHWYVLLPPWRWAAGLTGAGSGTVDVMFRMASAASESRGPTLGSLIVVVWLAGTLGSLLTLLVASVRLRRSVARAAPLVTGPWPVAADAIASDMRLRRAVVLLQTDAADLLATWGFLRPRIALPSDAANWSADHIRAVLRHELAHVRRNDWFVQLTAHVLCAWQWFNPLCWIALRWLRECGEMACDDEVLRGGLGARDYALRLLDVTRACRRASLMAIVVPMARPTGFERRITAMLNPEIDRRPVSWRAAALMFVALSLVLLPVAVLTAAQGTKPAEAEAAGPKPAAALKVGGAIKPPRKVHDVQPVYPEAMKEAGISGNVEIEVTVGKDGAVRRAHVLTTDVHPDLAVAAVDAVRQWKFEPTLLNGAPVEVTMKCTIAFRLD